MAISQCRPGRDSEISPLEHLNLGSSSLLFVCLLSVHKHYFVRASVSRLIIPPVFVCVLRRGAFGVLCDEGVGKEGGCYVL